MTAKLAQYEIGLPHILHNYKHAKFRIFAIGLADKINRKFSMQNKALQQTCWLLCFLQMYSLCWSKKTYQLAQAAELHRSILKMVINTISAKGAYFIQHAEEKGRGWLSVAGQGSMVINFDGSVGEYSSYRLVYDNKRHFA